MRLGYREAMETGGIHHGLRSASRVVIAVLAIGITAYWVGVTGPALASPPPDGYSVGPTAPGRPFFNEMGRLETEIGCAASKSSTDLMAFFSERQGPLLGWDNPHVMELGPDRWLWLVHDTYLDYRGDAQTLHDVGGQIQNAAFVQEGSCFSVVHGGTPERRRNFETGNGQDSIERFLWPLGGEVDGDVLKVFWNETVPADEPTPVGEGITRYPVKTWLAQYDVETLERISFEEAPNSGVDPVYGFAVASDETHSYLFGNSNQLNLLREGGYDNGPHSATKMYLARVPRGKLEQMPEYWSGTGWSDDESDATTITDRFWVENTMQPRYIDGQWMSVVQRDGFFSGDVYFELADSPTGPWVAVDTVDFVPRASEYEKNSYQPVILPWSSPELGLQVAISENTVVWLQAVNDPPEYRPSVFEFPWPADPDALIADALGALASGSAEDG